MRRHVFRPATLLLVVATLCSGAPEMVLAQVDPVVERIIELGTTDNQVMKWADYATNRFGGRLTGSDAYTNAAEWALWQFRQWGIQAELHEVGEMEVGFNRGPWFGKMVTPRETSLYFGTPSYTAGTRGLQRGRVVIMEADPFSINGRNPSPEEVEEKRLAVEEALAEVAADPEAFNGAWVLIPGENSGFARDGRRNTPEYSDTRLMPPLTRALVDAGALGTIQRAGLPLRILDGHVTDWDHLPELPDIKLLDTQYDEIRALVEDGQEVELEFDIRNWFKMGPVKYHNIVATIPGRERPDELVIMGGHFDSYDGGTGGVDDGSGFSPGMEALRLIQAAGGRPKRSVVMILFAAEEAGLVGSQVWLADHPELHDRIVAMINRDGSPSAITGIVVPPSWEDDVREVAGPLESLDPRWPFSVEVNPYPAVRPTSPGGTDASSFAKEGVPLVNFRTETDYSYIRAWHTLYDLYSELVPYTEHQEHSALVMAVMAYGMANLDETLSREDVYLPDGLFADIVTASGARLMVSLDHENAPLQVTHFIRIAEGNTGPPARSYGRGGRTTSVGRVTEVVDGVIHGVVESETQASMMVRELPLPANSTVPTAGTGTFGLTGPNSFAILSGQGGPPAGSFTPMGRVVAGSRRLADLASGMEIRTIRILRSGEAAAAFPTDDASFQELLAGAGG